MPQENVLLRKAVDHPDISQVNFVVAEGDVSEVVLRSVDGREKRMPSVKDAIDLLDGQVNTQGWAWAG